MKRFWLLLSLTLTIAVVTPRAARDSSSKTFHLVEATIADIQHAFRDGLLDPARLTAMYQARIAAYDQAGPQLNAYMHLNAHALDQARALGRGKEDDDHGRRIDRDAPLWGIPVILKDNVDTADMPTTAGSVALGGSIPPDYAFIARKIRRAGAIILGKATLTEYANFLTNGMPAGFSSQLRFQLGGTAPTSPLGYGFNPFDPRTDPRAGFNDGR